MKQKTKTLIGKTAITIGVFSILILAMFLIVKYTRITNIEELRALVESVGIWGWLVFLIIQVLATTFLCFVPGVTIAFNTASIILFGWVNALIIAVVGIALTSSNLFFIGDKLGEKVAIWLVGEDNLKKAQDLVETKSKILLPITFMLPIFPDNAMCIVAGMTKMKYWYFLLIAFIFRGIGSATIIFLGSGIIDYSSFSLVDWFLIINVLAIDFIVVVKTAFKVDKRISNKKKEKI
ncbi:MAG TPA: TVP38/TMEM64 family protein [Gallicola sp.]|nr:TVP38/TMEM64 family protein [Gallicola sp.]